MWKHEVYGNIAEKKKRYLAHIRGIQEALSIRPSQFLSNLETTLVKEYNRLTKLDAQYWQQHSRLKWLSEGEQNTSYFHRMVVVRRR